MFTFIIGDCYSRLAWSLARDMLRVKRRFNPDYRGSVYEQWTGDHYVVSVTALRRKLRLLRRKLTFGQLDPGLTVWGQVHDGRVTAVGWGGQPLDNPVEGRLVYHHPTQGWVSPATGEVWK